MPFNQFALYSGFKTVGFGPGGTSQGDYNVYDGSSVSAAIMQALSNSAGVILLAGTWNLDQVITMPGSGRVIVLGPGAVVRNVPSGATGFISTTGNQNQVIFAGGRIEVNTWVNSQKLFNITSGGSLFRIQDADIDCTTTGGNNSTPMDVFSATSVYELEIDGFSCSPNTGFRVINTTSISGLTMKKVRIRTRSSSMSSPRACYEAIRVTGSTWVDVDDIRVIGLGTLTTAEMNEVIVFQGSASSTAAIQANNIVVEQCVSPKLLSLYGNVGFQFHNTRLSNPGGAIAVNGEAALYISSTDDNATSTAPDESKICGAGYFDGLILESCATGTGNCVYIKNGKKIDFNQIHIHCPTSGPQDLILLNSDSSKGGGRSIHFMSGRWDGTVGTTRYGVAFENQGVPANIRDVRISPSITSAGLSCGITAGREPAAAGFAAKAGFSDGSVLMGGHLSAAGLPAATNSTGVTLSGIVTEVPQTTSLNSGTTSGFANYTAAVLLQKINQMNGAWGHFQLDLTDSTTSVSTGDVLADPGTAAAYNNNSRIMLLKLNSLIQLPQTAAGKITFLKTWVNGAGTAGAMTKLDYSAITGAGGTASLAGIVGACSSVATARDQQATLGLLINTMIDYMTLFGSANISTLASV